MTTIVAVKNRMLADSKVTLGKGYSYPTTKIIKARNMLVGAAGHAGDCSRFLEWATEDFRQKAKPKFECPDGHEDAIDGLVVKLDGIFYFCPSYPSPEKINAEFYAIGSGSKAARAPMLLGATPEKAMDIACLVDDYSGSPILILELDNGKEKIKQDDIPAL